MIGVNIRGANFRGAQNYLFAGNNGTRIEPDRVAWVHLRNLPIADPHKAAALMQATASQNPRVTKPVEHIILNPPPDAELSRRAMRQMADRTLEDLGLGEHQAVIVEHHDLDRRHVHILVNRVHPETLKAWDPSYSKRAMNRSLDRQARELGLPAVRRRETAALHPTEDLSTSLSKGAYQKALRSHREPFADLIRERAKTAMGEASSWEDLSHRLGDEGLRVEACGAGLIVTDTHEVAKASSIDRALSRRRLEERFEQPFAAHRQTLGEEATRPLPSLRESPGSIIELPTAAARADRLLDRLAATRITFDEATIRRHSFWDKEGKALYRAALESDRLRRLETPRGTLLTTEEALARQPEALAIAGSRQHEEPAIDASHQPEPLAIDDSHRAEALVETMSRHQAVFTRADLASRTRREGLSPRVAELASADPRLVDLRRDRDGTAFLTTPDYLEAEQNLFRAARELTTSRVGPKIPTERVEARLTENRHDLSPEQQKAVRAITADRDLELLSGRAGTGKSRLFREVSDLYREAGFRVRGAALSGAAAENLNRSAGVESRTLASLELTWRRDRDRLTSRDVLIVDEAGMVGTRQMERLLKETQKGQSKLILAGDEKQLRPIEAGEPFRGLVSEHGGAYLQTIRRQQLPWQAEASADLAEGRTAQALATYDNAGRIEWYPSRDASLRDLVLRYREDARAAPNETRLALAYRRADAERLNREIRAARKELGQLGDDVTLRQKSFAPGDRILFLQNDHQGRAVETIRDAGDSARGVKNGTFATVTAVTRDTPVSQTATVAPATPTIPTVSDDSTTRPRLEAELDTGRTVAFNPNEYTAFDHGYAATIHKAQGATVDRVYFVPDRLIERDAAYVALTRHAHDLSIHVDRETFPQVKDLATHLAREPLRDLARDHRSVAELETLAAQEKRRADLQTQLDRITQAQSVFSRTTQGLGRDRARAAAFRERFRADLQTVFRNPEKAERTLDRALTTRQFPAVVHDLSTSPERFGKLNGRSSPLPSRERTAARASARSAAKNLEQATGLEHRASPSRRKRSGRSLRSSISLARSASYLSRELATLPSEEVVSRTAQRALRSLGAARVAQAVPTPVYLTTIAATTIRRAAQEIGRAKGQGIGHRAF